MIHLFPRFVLPVLLLLAVAAVPGCDATKNVNDGDVYLLSIEELDTMLADRGQGVRLIDVRGSAAYRKGHLPGAMNIPLPELRRPHPELAGGSDYVVYASGPMDPLSLAAAKKMIKLGYAPVYDFRGGVEMWTADDRELVKAD